MASIEQPGARAARVPSWSKLGTDAVLVALGLNVWVSLLLVPAAFVGAFQRLSFLLLAAVPLATLAIGAVRKSPLWLLLLYPSVLTAPIALDPRIVSGHVHGPLTFGLLAIGLVAYLLGASYLTTLRELPAPERVRRLSSASQPVQPRWKRRSRIYVALISFSAIYPLVLLYAVNFSSPARTFLKSNYPGRAGSMTLLLNLGVLGLWLLLFIAFFLRPLKQHRTGDRELTVAIEEMRHRARKGSPRPMFYLAVVAALVFMGLLIHLRYR